MRIVVNAQKYSWILLSCHQSQVVISTENNKRRGISRQAGSKAESDGFGRGRSNAR